MGREPYECTTCKRTFSRKNNAERHNNSRHDGMSVVFNKDTGWRSDTTKETKFLFSSPSPPSSFSSSKIASGNTTSNDTIPSSRVLYPNLEDLVVGIPDPKIDIKSDDEKIIKIFGKMFPFINELDMLLSIFDHVNRKKILSGAIISSLTSLNPISSLKDHLNFYQAIIALDKASSSVSESQNITQNQAKEMLKTIILTAPYSKNENKFNK